MKKNTFRKMVTIITALVTALSFSVLAGGRVVRACEKDENIAASSSVQNSIDPEKEAYYKEVDRNFNRLVQLEKLDQMKRDKIEVSVMNNGYYIAKKAVLYGRKIVDVDENGNFILSNWEVIDNRTNMCNSAKYFTVPANYVCFGYSLDVVLGTDFPFSKVFWSNPDQQLRKLSVQFSGGCRNVNMRIYVNDKLIVDEWNCSSHKEWKPC